MPIPDPSKVETETEVTYSIWTEGSMEPGYLTVHKTTPYSYTLQPSAAGAAGKTWSDIVQDIDVSLGLAGA